MLAALGQLVILMPTFGFQSHLLTNWALASPRPVGLAYLIVGWSLVEELWTLMDQHGSRAPNDPFQQK